MANIQRIAFRQLYAIRHQVLGALGAHFRSRLQFDLMECCLESAPYLEGHLREIARGRNIELSHDTPPRNADLNYTQVLHYCVDAHERDLANEDPVMYRYIDDKG
jgi:hypothetical protein